MAKVKDKKRKNKNDSAELNPHVPATNGVGNDHNGTGDDHADVVPKMKRADFEKEVLKLQVELVKLQEWVKATGAKVMVVFEGRDTAGKGGVIKAITARTSPRVFRTVALSAPTEREKSQMYIQRYITHFPAAGEVILFDRSWYNRAGVESVMGFATPDEVDIFLKDVPGVEHAITRSGTILIKYWLEVSAENQTKRIEERIEEYVKVWKLTPMDLESYTRWDDYTKARNTMFEATDTEENPWYVVNSNDQRRGRLNCISHMLSLIPYEEVKHPTVKLPKRKVGSQNLKPGYPYHLIPEKY